MDTLNTQFKWQEATGRAQFISDRQFDDLLESRLLRSTCPRGKIVKIDIPTLPEGYHVFGADDVPGRNELQMVEADWPVFADKEVRYVGQIILLVVGEKLSVIDDIISKIIVEYDESTPVYTAEDSKKLIDGPIHSDNNILDHHKLSKGDIEAGFAQAVEIVEETVSTGYQEHIYIEPQGVVGYYQDEKVVIEGSMQCPWYVHHSVSIVLGHENVRAIQAATGGGFGGKEDYPDVIAGPVGVAVNKLKRPVRLVLEREEDIAFTSKRHPLTFNYKTGLDADGNIIAMDIKFDINAGAYLSLSGIVLQRAITTCTNVYDIPNAQVEGTAWATNSVPNGAFRGFGSPQTVFGFETHLNHLAHKLNIDPYEFKRRQLLHTQSQTLTGAQIFGDLVLDQMVEKLCSESDYHQKAASYKQQPLDAEKRKGIGIALFQHGCGFAGDLEDTLVKAKVRIKKGADNQIEIQASNTDIGQGLSLTFCKIVAKTLGVPLHQVTLAAADTGSVPDSGPTVASRSIVIVGYLLEKAATVLKDGWIDGEEQIVERDYKKPEYHKWNQETFSGNAYQATSYGANVVEVEVDTATGEAKIIGLWGVYDVGKAIDAQVFKGQIDGGFVQALGYGSIENLTMGSNGVFEQTNMADYVIPTSQDVPAINSTLIDNPYKYGPHGAKGGGELTHNGGAAAFCAAVESAIKREFNSIPVTSEKILLALESPMISAEEV